MPASSLPRAASGGTLVRPMAEMLVNVANATNLPYLQGLSGIIQQLMESAQRVRQNRENYMRLSDSAYQFMLAIYDQQTSNDAALDPKLLYQIERLTEKLGRVLSLVRNQGNRSLASRLFRQLDDANIVADCEREIKQALELYGVQSAIGLQQSIARLHQIQRDRTNEIHEAIDTLEVTDRTSYISGPRSESPQRDLLRPLPVLPPRPQTFHGRDAVLNTLVNLATLEQPARVAILGPAGVGKSSLAQRLLHEEKIVTMFDLRRYFIACDAANSLDSLLSTIHSYFNLPRYQEDNSRNILSEEIAAFLSYPGQRSLMVLDNFESPWEPLESRKAVEDFLSLLASVDSLVVFITIRGVERPFGPQWTKPFLGPLLPLDALSTRQTFLDISGIPSDDPHLDDVIELSGNLPLAVTLMANLAQCEDSQSLLRRWKYESTAMLDRGNDRRNSLDISIELSLSSPRILSVPQAQELLSLFTLLPDGIPEGEVKSIAPNLLSAAKCAAALRQTSLVYVDGHKRLRVLAPVRAFMLQNHPPVQPHIAALEQYVWNLVKTTESIELEACADVIKSITSELGNVKSVIEYALEQNDSNHKKAIQGAIDFARYLKLTSPSRGSPIFLQKACTLAEKIGDKALLAGCLYMRCHTGDQSLETDDPADDYLSRALTLYKELGDVAGQAACLEHLGILSVYKNHRPQALDYMEQALRLYSEVGNSPGQVLTLLGLSKLARWSDDTSLALDRTTNALDIARQQLKSPALEARCLQALGEVLAQRSEPDRALSAFRESIELFDKLGLQTSPWCLHAHASLGEVAFDQSDMLEAATRYRRVYPLYHRMRLQDREANSLVMLGRIEAALGNEASAVEHLQLGMAIWRDKLHSKWGEAWAHCGFGDVRYAREDFEDASKDYRRARHLFWQLGRRTDEGVCHMKLGDISLAQGELTLASMRYVTAFALYRKTMTSVGQAQCMRRLGNLALADNDDATAMNLYMAARVLLRRMGIRRDEAYCLLGMGDIHFQNSRKSRALKLWNNALEVFKAADDLRGARECFDRVDEHSEP